MVVSIVGSSLQSFDILKSTRRVLDSARRVDFSQKAIEKNLNLIKARIDKGFDEPESLFNVLPSFRDSVQLVFIEDAVNYCFWAKMG